MGCRHYFDVDLVEELVDEGGSRSASRAHDHESFQVVSQQNVANPDILKSMSTSFNIERSDCEHTTGLPVLS